MVVQHTTKSFFLFIFLVALQSSPCITTTISQDTSTSHLEQVLCNASNPSPSPSFEQYLDNAINELKPSARADVHFKYYSAIANYTPIVHASYLCQSDISSKRCFNCVSSAAKTAQSSCSKWSTEAVVYEDVCTFRYSDKSFYGRFDNSSSYVDLSYGPLDSNVVQFGKALTQAIDAIVTDLRSKSNYGAKVATEVVDVQGTKTKIYAMGECTWDLYQEDCRLCVHECASMLPAGKVGGRVMLPSCNFRYETSRFYGSVAPSTSQPSPSTGPGGRRPTPPPPPPPPKKKKSNKKAIAAGTGGGAAGLLVAAGVLTWAYQKKKTMQAAADTEAGQDDSENFDAQAGEETIAGLATGTKESSDPANGEESKSMKQKPPPRPSRGPQNNTGKKPPPRH